MPIINSYNASISSSGIIEGGTVNNSPFPYALTTFVSIPINEKFLLIPARQESREVDLSFSKPVDLYFSDNTIPFKSLSVLEKYKDNQLGVDLFVKTKELNCECLIIIRSMKVIDITPTPTPSPTPTPTPTPEPVPQWGIISPDKLLILIDSSKYPNSITELNVNIIVPNPLSILYFDSWTLLSSYVPNGEYYDNEWELYGNTTDYPTIENAYTVTLLSGATTLEINAGNEYNSETLKIKEINFTTNTISVEGFMQSSNLYRWYPPNETFQTNEYGESLATINVVIPSYLSIPNYQAYNEVRLIGYYDNGSSSNSNHILNFSSFNYPTTPIEADLNQINQDFFMFILKGSNSYVQLKPLNFDIATKTLTLGL